MVINPYPCTSLEAAGLYIKAHPELKVGLTSGTFDLFHDFHERYLERCLRALGYDGILIVGVDSDAEVRRVKGKGRPIQSEYQRRMLLEANKNPTFTFIQDGVGDFQTVAEALLGIRGGMVFRNEAFEGHEDQVAVGSAKDKVRVVIIPDINELDSTSALTDCIQGRTPEPEPGPKPALKPGQTAGVDVCIRCHQPVSKAEADTCNDDGMSLQHMASCPLIVCPVCHEAMNLGDLARSSHTDEHFTHVECQT